MASLLKARRNPEVSKLPKNLRLPIMELKCFIKNEQGFNSYFNKPNFDFKSENEWRYVPEKWKIDGNYISQSRKVYDKKPEIYNKKLSDYSLNFDLDDLDVVFVADKPEIELLVNKFEISREIIKLATWKDNKLDRAVEHQFLNY
nr:abortive infection system antitoxin AbiGi family protein [Muricauda sp. SCSIO 64092]